MSDSFAPMALFLDCSHLYHKLRASDEALACGYRGVAATPLGVRRLGDGSDFSDRSDFLDRLDFSDFLDQLDFSDFSEVWDVIE